MSPPSTIAHYRITSKLGEGGMGAVYRATDTKLNREVAIKVLPESFAEDPDRMARFTREAQVLASLNHPNIAVIYGIEDKALILELVPGATLEERIAAGPVPREDAVDIARQIAEALEAAHEKGVTHRDLKPANVKVTPEGIVKVLDFGLAKTEESFATSGSSANSPTLTIRATQAGIIMGTAGYMAPEQAAGKPVDKRADIWSFGVVLYEMLSGKRLFEGETVAHTLADVLRAEIDLAKLPASTPPAVRALIERCLDRSVKSRLRDIGEARIALSRAGESAPAPAAQPKSRSLVPWWIAAAAVAFAIAQFGFNYFWRTALAPPIVTRFTLPLPENTSELPTSAAPMAVPSPDGRYIAFPLTDTNIGKSYLWVREIGSVSARPLPKTEHASFPFWSPDSQSIGYFSQTGIERVSLADGAVRTICETGTGVFNRGGGGGAWNRDGVVIFQTQDALQQCPASGGSPTPATQLDPNLGENAHIWPQFLPDGKRFLYLARTEDPQKSAIFVQELGSKTRVRILNNLTRAAWAPPGWLLFARDEMLMAQRIDPPLHLSGEPVTLEPSLAANDQNGRAAFAVSETGVLVGRPSSGDLMQLTFFDRSGKQLGVLGKPGTYSNLRLSPDEKAASVNQYTRRPLNNSTWTVDLTSGVFSRATFDPSQTGDGAVWAPDGRRLAFARSGGSLWQQTLGSSNAAEIPAGVPAGNLRDWSPDGSVLIATDAANTRSFLLSMSGDRKSKQVLDLPFTRTEHRVSPDGQKVAITMGEGGQINVYVASFPSFGGRRQVSVTTGNHPVWSKDSRELFFIAPGNMLMAVQFRPGNQLDPGAPQPLFRLKTRRRGNRFAAMADGRFLVMEGVEGNELPQNMVVLNWTAGLKP